MKKHSLSRTINTLRLRAPRRRIYYASISIAGKHIAIPIDAPNYRCARAEAETIMDECGILFSIVEV